MGLFGWLWLSEELAQAKEFVKTLNPKGRLYKEMSELIAKAEAETADEDK